MDISNYCWIMLTSKLPTVVSPPKMSIHFSEPWPDTERLKKNEELKYKNKRGLMLYNEGQEDADFTCPNIKTCRAILFKGERIRVYDHEYSIMTPKKFNDYYPEAYDFIEESASIVPQANLDKDQKAIYDAARVDGCNDFQALLVSLGGSAEESEIPPPMGWFKIKDDYGRVYCTEEELTISDLRKEGKEKFYEKP